MEGSVRAARPRFRPVPPPHPHPAARRSKARRAGEQVSPPSSPQRTSTTRGAARARTRELSRAEANRRLNFAQEPGEEVLPRSIVRGVRWKRQLGTSYYDCWVAEPNGVYKACLPPRRRRRPRRFARSACLADHLRRASTLAYAAPGVRRRPAPPVEHLRLGARRDEVVEHFKERALECGLDPPPHNDTHYDHRPPQAQAKGAGDLTDACGIHRLFPAKVPSRRPHEGSKGIPKRLDYKDYKFLRGSGTWRVVSLGSGVGREAFGSDYSPVFAVFCACKANK
eukprot:scaffold2.g7507.t1